MESETVDGVPSPWGMQEHTHAHRFEEGLHRRAVTSMKDRAVTETKPILEIDNDETSDINAVSELA